MRPSRSMTERWIVFIAIVLVVLGLVIWAVRPSPLSEWLRSEGVSDERPLTALADGFDGRLAPMTPAGFLTLFPPLELAVLLALLASLSILFVLLSPQWRIHRIGFWLAQPITSLRIPRIGVRVRTAMAQIVVVGFLPWLGDRGLEKLAAERTLPPPGGPLCLG